MIRITEEISLCVTFDLLFSLKWFLPKRTQYKNVWLKILKKVIFMQVLG